MVSSKKNHARDCQEIEELKSICCEGADRARQASSDEPSMQQERESSNLESDDGSDSGIAEQSKFLVRCKRILRS